MAGDRMMLTIVLVKITLLVMVAYLVAIGLRRASAGSRHLVWLATLVGLVALPLLGRWRSLRLPVLPVGEHIAAPVLLAPENHTAPSATVAPAPAIATPSTATAD